MRLMLLGLILRKFKKQRFFVNSLAEHDQFTDQLRVEASLKGPGFTQEVALRYVIRLGLNTNQRSGCSLQQEGDHSFCRCVLD